MTERQPFRPLGMPPDPEAPLDPVPPPKPPPPSDPDAPFWNYTDLALFIGMAIPCMLLGFGLVRGLEAVFHFRPRLRTIELLPAQILAYALMSIGLWLMFRLQYGRPFWRSLGWKPLRAPALLLIVAGLLTAFGVSAIGVLLQTPATSNPLTEMLEDPTSLALIAVFGTTMAPLFEELAFRGFLQPLLVRSLGVVAGISVSAVAFGLLHFQEYGNSWRHAVLISLAGGAFAVVRHVTGSTKASTLMHASYNALFFLALLLQRGQLPHR